ncbi:FliM/FliN family flagellar motor switch protein [Aestuariibius insulae]|uniref:FliM/FliN family flagellar motor switch protein n=1 Tax=Aestuariibius insulae TaxID=2058287 RepID=UPI00345EAEBD
MTREGQTDPVLRRKLRPVGAGAGRDDADLKILGRALRKGAEQAIDLDLRVVDGREEVRSLLDCLADLTDDLLILLMRGPNERYGLVVLDHQVMSATIEVATTGRVAADPSEPRRPTHTDASMAASLIDAMLLQVLDLAEGTSLAKRFRGYGHLTLLSELSAAELLLNDGSFRITDLEVALGEAGRSGRIQIILPEPVQAMSEKQANVETWRSQFKSRLMCATADLEAVLHRPNLPLAELRAFKVGSIVPVPVAALSSVRIETLSGATVARGRLGQVSGARALRLVSEVMVEPVFDLAKVASPEDQVPELRIPQEHQVLDALEGVDNRSSSDVP